MNGYNYPSHGTGDDRQAPSIPSITQLHIERPISNASPNPSQLPPLNHSFQGNSAHLPPLPRTTLSNSNYQSSPGQYPPDRTPHLSQLAPQPSFPSQYPPYVPQYPTAAHQAYALPSSYQTGEPNHTNSHTYPAPGPHPPAYTDTDQKPDPRNLLPPFNPRPSQQQPVNHDHRVQEQRPLPVVGSQGRRGVLPSAPGRPPIGSGVEIRGQLANNAVKGPDGKYQCQFCSKVYLHLKHLKRHHLRHTGERPYQCSLCKETFCRSDILKRHFQKCSIRRGNPTGANHLTHAQDHLRRGSTTPSADASASGTTQTNGTTVAGQSAPPSSYRPNWPNGVLQSQAGQDAGSARTSRSSSVIHRPGSAAEDRKSIISAVGTGPITGQTSINPSPSSSGGEDRKYAHQMPGAREMPPSHFHEQAPHHAGSGAPQYGGHYNQAPHHFPPGGQHEFPGFGYGHTNGYNYSQPPPQQQQHHETPRYGDGQWSQYQQFFQAGSQDPVMSYQNHQQ